MFGLPPSVTDLGDPCRIRVLNTQIDNECTIQEVWCLRRSKFKTAFFYIFSILTLGFVWLMSYWSNKWRRKLLYKFSDVQSATHFQFLNWDDEWNIVMREQRVSIGHEGEAVTKISFHNRFMRYDYDPQKEVFSTSRYQLGQRLDLLSRGQPSILTDQQRHLLEADFGPNLIEVPIRSKLNLFIAEVLSPFQVFQFYAIILWLCQKYYIFPIVLIIASVFTYIYNVRLIQQAQKKLKDDSLILVNVDVIKNPTNHPLFLDQRIDSSKLVPGDMFYLHEAARVPCDCIVLQGCCLVNENYMTGDSYPIRKAAIQNFVYRSESENDFTLFMGTEVLEIHETCSVGLAIPQALNKALLCLATRTGYYTTRGQYLRSILYPKTHSFQFYNQSIKFIFILLIITVFGYIVVCLKVADLIPPSQLLITLLDLISTSIPPTLPTAMSVGIGFAIQRLSQIGIKCTVPQKILVGGEVETVVFQKTGTLTKKEVRVVGFALCQSGRITGTLNNPSEARQSRYAHTAFQAMSCCHSISRSILTRDLLGRPTDIAMLQFCSGTIADEPSTIQIFGRRLKVEKRFQLTNLSQRMGVIVQSDDGQKRLFVKGDPEKLLRNCRKDTVPNNIGQFIGKFAEKGYKLMAITAKVIMNEQETSEQLKKLEKQMLFLGILMYESARNPASQEIVRQLLKSNVQVIITSADSQFTSAAVAHSCGMLQNRELMHCDLQIDSRGKRRVLMRGRDSKGTNLEDLEALSEPKEQKSTMDDEFVKDFVFSLDEHNDIVYSMTGRLFQELFMKRNIPQLVPIFNKTILFSRMLPKHKIGLFHHYTNVGRVTSFVSQNTGQASGLREADLSLALTQGQMSSYSHFSSLNGTLISVIDLLRVCRAGLSTNYQTFKMMCQFSLMEFTTMIVLYLNYQELNNTQNLYIDLFIMCPIFITLSMTEPCDSLSKFVPPTSLFSRFNILSMAGLFLIQLAGQFFIVETLKSQTFYTDNIHKKEAFMIDNASYNDGLLLSSTLFIFTNFLYMGVVVATSISKPFRKEFYTNPYLVANIVLLTVYNIIIPFYPDLVPESMGIDQNNTDWYVFVVFCANLICLIMYVFERVLVAVMNRFPVELQ